MFIRPRVTLMIRIAIKSLDLKKIFLEIPSPKPTKFIFSSNSHPLELISELQMLGKLESHIQPEKNMLLPEWIKKGNNIVLDSCNRKYHFNLDCAEIDNLLKEKNSKLFSCNRKLVIMENFNNIIKHNQRKILNRWRIGGFGYLGAQLSTLLYLTYGEKGLTWDVVEPVTCLLGIATSIASILFYKIYFTDYTYEQLFDKLTMKAKEDVFNSWHIQREFQKMTFLLDVPQDTSFAEYNDFYKKCKLERQELVKLLSPWISSKMLKEWKSVNPHWMPRLAD
eukprot:NODE_369_length_9975_cov_0.256582.p2 type:complete len:280 gc:universal NODE_369_length_9975_cov_0.256582:5918-5079(-)